MQIRVRGWHCAYTHGFSPAKVNLTLERSRDQRMPQRALSPWLLSVLSLKSHGWKDQCVERLDQPPVSTPNQPRRDKYGSLIQSCAAVGSWFYSELQPGAPTSAHFGSQRDHLLRLNGFHSPPVHVVIDPQLVFVLTSASQPVATKCLV